MKLSKVLIYLVILAVVATYIYVFEIRKKQEKMAAEKKAAQIVDIEANQLTHIIINSKGHGEIEIKKPTSNWVLIKPVKSKCDDSAMASWTRSITGAERESVVAKKDVKWSEFGFDDPNLTVTISSKDKTFKVVFGAQNPAKTSYYARVDSNKELLLVADTLKNSLDKSAFDLRDKTVVAIATKDVERVVYSDKGSELELKKEGTAAWRMVKPQTMRVKGATVDRDVLRLTNLKARNIIDTPKSNGDPYGLKEPVRKITLSGNKLEQTLEIGKYVSGKEKGTPGPKKVYARIKGRSPVYVVDDWVLTKLETNPEKLQDKSLFSFDPAEIHEIELKFNGKTWLAVQDKDKKWNLQQPTKIDKIDTWLVTTILWDLKDIQWKELKKPAADLSSYHLDKPQLIATLSVKDKKEPIVFKAGWTQEPASAPNQESSEAGKSLAKEAESKVEAKSDKASTKLAAKPENLQQQAPKTVYATVTPHEEKDSIFIIDGKIVTRIREDLERLMKKEEK
jgi:hypothetical protein